jgi:hypothetical protein
MLGIHSHGELDGRIGLKLSWIVTDVESVGPMFVTTMLYCTGVNPAVGVVPFTDGMVFITDKSVAKAMFCVVEFTLLVVFVSVMFGWVALTVFTNVPVTFDANVPLMMNVTVSPKVRLIGSSMMSPVPEVVLQLAAGAQVHVVPATRMGVNMSRTKTPFASDGPKFEMDKLYDTGAPAVGLFPPVPTTFNTEMSALGTNN